MDDDEQEFLESTHGPLNMGAIHIEPYKPFIDPQDQGLLPGGVISHLPPAEYADWRQANSDPLGDILAWKDKIHSTYGTEPTKMFVSPFMYRWLAFEMRRHKWAEQIDWERWLFPRWHWLAQRWRRRPQPIRNWRRERRWARMEPW